MSKGGYIVVEQGGGITPFGRDCVLRQRNSYAVLSPPRGVWGHAPPNGNLDSLRAPHT